MDSENSEIAQGDIVQLHPKTTTNPAFRGCLMVVDEVKSWGVIGYVQALGDREAMGGQAYHRADFGTFERTGGVVKWIIS